jgi:hypothetical protein
MATPVRVVFARQSVCFALTHTILSGPLRADEDLQEVDELWWLKSTEHTAAALAKSVYILVAPRTVGTTVDWKVCPDIKVVMLSLSASLFFLTACSAEHVTILQLLPWGCFGRDGEGGARQKRGPQHVVVPEGHHQSC